jgi:hypothetical protein
MADTQQAPAKETEVERIARWRLHVLLEAGVPLTIAERVADHPEIEYRQLLSLIERGCDPGLAFDILRA